MLARHRRARRAHRAAGPRGQLLAVGPDGTVRPVLGAVPGSRARLRPRRRSPRRRHRALPGVLEPRVHAVRAARGLLAHGAAAEEHRHRHGARPDGGDAPGRAVGVRDRLLPSPGRVRRAAVGPPVRAGRRHHARAARAGRPRPRGRVPAGRRRGAFQRGSRLHPAPDPPARDPPGPLAGHRRSVRGGPLRRGGGDDGRRLSRASIRTRRRSTAGPRGGGGLLAHARPGRAAAGRARRARASRGCRRDPRRGRLPAARHLRVPIRDDAGDPGRAGPRGRRGGLRGAHGGRPGDRAGGRPRHRRGRPTRSAWRASPATPASRPASSATSPRRRTPWSGRWSARTAPCS